MKAGQPGWGGFERISNLHQTMEERFFSFENLPRQGRVLEIGCGAGQNSIELAKRGYQVVGIDFSPMAVEWAQRNAEHENCVVEFKVADVSDLSAFPADSFDLVFDGNCLHCLSGDIRTSALSEIHRVLKPGAIFFVSSMISDEEASAFPETFDVRTRILFDSGLPCRFVPTSQFIEEEIENSGFHILKRMVRNGKPFGHTCLHVQKRALTSEAMSHW